MSRRGRRGKVGGSRTVFARMVSHPGTKAQPFLGPALKGANVLLSRLTRRTLGRVSTSDRAAFRRALDDNVRAVATAVKTRAQRLVPVDTGRLKGSINVRQESAFRYTVGTNVAYARFIEEGTRPHIIRPTKRKFLRFGVRGGKKRGRRGRRR